MPDPRLNKYEVEKPIGSIDIVISYVTHALAFYGLISFLLDFLMKKLTPHMFRHTFATQCINKGINVYNVSRVLGHSSLKTTEIYLHTCVDDVTKQLNSVRLYS